MTLTLDWFFQNWQRVRDRRYLVWYLNWKSWGYFIVRFVGRKLMRQRIWQMGGESQLCAALAWNGFTYMTAAENAECQNQNSGIAVPAKMYESIPCKIWTFWRFQRHIVWSSLLHSSCTYTSHPMYISSICDKCDISYWFFFLSFVDFVLVIVTTIFKFMSSLLHSSSRCPIWEVVTVHIHRIICTFLLFVINVMFLIDFFPYFCWFCFSYRQYDIQNYVHR